MLESQPNSNEADREEEATDVGQPISISTAISAIEPAQLIGTRRRQVTVGGGQDMSALGSDLHESGYSNDNAANKFNSLEPSKLRIVRILAPEATQNGTQNVTMGKFVYSLAWPYQT